MKKNKDNFEIDENATFRCIRTCPYTMVRETTLDELVDACNTGKSLDEIKEIIKQLVQEP